MSGTESIKARVTIFGGTGDLTCRKLMPALYNLLVSKQLDPSSHILAIGRRPYTKEEYHAFIHDWIMQFARIGKDGEKLTQFLSMVDYLQMDFMNIDEYSRLQKYNSSLHEEGYAQLLYLAVAPSSFEAIVKGCLTIDLDPNMNIILEKPFGDTLENAKKLNLLLEKAFQPQHLYRIDHYLGKEMIRNILSIRCSNPFFSNIWDSRSIECVEIEATETVGVEKRGGYYDAAGAVKDMVQNHLFQLLSITALEDPSASDIKAQQLAVLQSLRQVTAENIKDSAVFGQYEGYTQEPKISENSTTETYAALKLYVDAPRWKDVPFIIRTGKKCSDRHTSVIITLKPSAPGVPRNRLVIRIQPSEEIQVQFNVKEPGNSDALHQVELEYCQSCMDIFSRNTPEAYERMLNACMHNDAEWFSQWDQIETSWKFIDQLKKAYKEAGIPVYAYPQMADGPVQKDALLPQSMRS